MQFIHEEDVGRALLLCVVGAGPPGAYNIAGDGVAHRADVAREFGALPIPVPAGPAQAAARALAAAAVPAAGRRVGRGGQPPGDHGHHARPREQLGWQPRYTGLEALRDTLREPVLARGARRPRSRPASRAPRRPAARAPAAAGTWPTPASSR